MHLRRALLLFVVVLGLAALAASLSRPRSERSNRRAQPPAPVTPTVEPGPAATEPTRLSFTAGGRPQTRRLQAGRAATVTVRVREPGQVELQGLGLTTAAEAVTPARFEVLVRRPGRYPVRFMPAGHTQTLLAGVLRVVARPPT